MRYRRSLELGEGTGGLSGRIAVELVLQKVSKSQIILLFEFLESYMLSRLLLTITLVPVERFACALSWLMFGGGLLDLEGEMWWNWHYRR